MGKSKMFVIFGVAIIGISLIYFFMGRTSSTKDELSEKMKHASRDYFEKYISVNETTSIYKITLDMLTNAPDNYDLSGMEKCDKNKTYSEVLVNFKTGKPKDITIKLSC